MTRETFLEEFWSPYPPARSDWLDVASFLKDSRRQGIVCGRLVGCGDRTWTLNSGGQEIRLTVSLDMDWIEDQKGAIFDENLLGEGDLIGVDVSADPVRERGFRADRVLLLAPHRAKYEAPSAFDFERSRAWSEFLRAVREFFYSRDFVEAFTPTLVPSPGTEPYLDPFSTEWTMGSHRQQFFLPTSPEFHLKKMLSLGWTRLFEIKTCFRNGEVGECHQPEFMMLEWYRAYRDLEAIADDVEDLIRFLGPRLGLASQIPDLQRVSMAELFAAEFGGFHLTPHTHKSELVELARQEGIPTSPNDTWDDVFFRLFLERIESKLGMKGPQLVRGYPPSQAALSRIGETGFADRFEVYWRGLELANAFHELNDPDENLRRFEADAARKKELNKTPVPLDLDLEKALYSGLPPSGGIALGLDRLFMAVYDIRSIQDVRVFPIQSPWAQE